MRATVDPLTLDESAAGGAGGPEPVELSFLLSAVSALRVPVEVAEVAEVVEVPMDSELGSPASARVGATAVPGSRITGRPEANDDAAGNESTESVRGGALKG